MTNQKKLKDLIEKKFRTNHLKDAFGNRTRVTEEYFGKITLKTVKAGPRFGHFIIDLIAFQIFIYVIEYLFLLALSLTKNATQVNLTISLVYAIVILLLYPSLYALCEFLWQKTPGKFLTKTIVVDEYGNKPSLRQITLRSLIRIVPFEPFSCYDDLSYGWHDSWSGTFVFTEEELSRLKELQSIQSNE